MIYKMEYKINDIGTFDGSLVRHLGNSEYVIRIGETEHNLRIISMNTRGIEFMLDKKYHRAKYLLDTTAQMDISVDGVPVTVNMHADMDKIVYKNSGGAGSGGAVATLKSPIPGKVVAINTAEGESVKKGDTVCTLESMKMQVGVKAHKDGTIKSIKIKEGGIVAKNDIVAEID